MSSRTAPFATVLAAWLASGAPLAATITFPVTIVDPGNTYVAYHDDVRAAIQGAGAAWAEVLEEAGDVSIEVQVTLGVDISTAAGSSATSVFVRNDGVRNIWEQSAAAEIRTGVDPNPGEPDIEFDVGADYLTDELWFDPDPFARSVPVPQNKTDAVSVFIHEFGHALAFNGWIDWATGMRPADFQSTFDEVTTSTVGAYRFHGPRSMHLYRSPVPLTNGNIYHFANSEGQAGYDLILDVMNGVVSLRGTRDEISGYVLAVAEDLNLPVGVNWSRYSRLAFKQSAAIKTLVADEDDDGDRSTNFFEFVQGTDPFDPQSVQLPTYTLVKNGSGYVAAIGFPLIRSLREVEIQPEVSLDLESAFSLQDDMFRPQDARASIQFVNYGSGQLDQSKWFARLRARTIAPAARQRLAQPQAHNHTPVTRLITGPKPIRRECLNCLQRAR